MNFELIYDHNVNNINIKEEDRVLNRNKLLPDVPPNKICLSIYTRKM